jgi:hypothetical protein
MSLLKSFFGTNQSTVTENASAIDVVTYVASLASDPTAIDPILDPMRELTSRIQPGQPLSQADQTTLAGVCQRLQIYLVEKDPLRSFDKAALQQKISQKFPKPDAAEATFWTKLK